MHIQSLVLLDLYVLIFLKNITEFSVLFIVVILWYPAFETLFSVLRKLSVKTKPTNPDNHHLHHLIPFAHLRLKKLFQTFLQL